MKRKKLYFALIGIGILILIGIYFNYNPAKYSFFPKCPFHYLTGLDCPGCGSQRAIYALLHGNIIGAIHQNLLLIISLPFLAIHSGYQALSFVKQKSYKWKVIYHPLTPKILTVIVVAFWIIRNLPGFPLKH
ncbi:DUF2752 domain-containing protein [Mucilaginibacter lacusdianchii]|uniref:DUF2752 domain-containing protein n=1 Tax=Mucilaginibacter lacusdianchii TaxID=2684211 RepID=UPI00131CC38F|nr:DUF2752 domain-containing protein [Mucilaginibacter sp. JXJ CY 39]